MNKILVTLLLGTALAACQSDMSEEGLHAQVGVTNEKSKDSTTDTEGGTTKQFVRDFDGKQFQLQTGLISLVPLDLVPCSVLARLKPLDWLISSAYAHGADEHAPGGLLDVSQPDGEEVEVGEIAAVPGEYCGVRVQIQPVAGAAIDEGEFDVNGKSTYVNACYYYKSGSGGELPASTHYCFTLTSTAASEEQVIALDEPVTLDATHRDADLHLVVNYDRWFERASADDAFSALDGYAAVADNAPCGNPVADATACTAAKNDFKASLQANTALRDLLAANVLDSLTARLATD